ncbi:MAG: diaminopimelate decarboxylase [Candidatus Hydrothermarchaeota archaeon]
MKIGNFTAEELVNRFGSPIYVYDETKIRENYKKFYKAFSKNYKKVLVCYAYKANSNLAICRILAREGAGADVVSAGELYISLLAGVPPEKIVFNGNNKTEEEIKMAIDTDILMINVDSLHELDLLQKIASRYEKSIDIAFRINPDVSPKTHPKISTGLRESKFGVDIKEAVNAYEKALEADYINPVGVHMHIGSQITEIEPFSESTSKIMSLCKDLSEKLDLPIEFVNLGGGLGIKYDEKQSVLSVDEYANVLSSIVKEESEEIGIDPTLILEPGRFIVGSSGTLLTKAGSIKNNPSIGKIVALEAGMNLLLRPALYGSYHRISVVKNSNKKIKTTVVGPLCESGDLFARERGLPDIDSGDIIAIHDVGAYGFSMSNQYNAVPRCAEVLVMNENADLIRKRETLSDLIQKQIIPERLL